MSARQYKFKTICDAFARCVLPAALHTLKRHLVSFVRTSIVPIY